MSDPRANDRDAASARRGRNVLLAVALFGFVVVVFVVTIVKLSQHGGGPFIR